MHRTERTIRFDLIWRTKGSREDRARHRGIIAHTTKSKVEDETTWVLLQNCPQFPLHSTHSFVPGYLNPARISCKTLIRVGALERGLETIGIVKIIYILNFRRGQSLPSFAGWAGSPITCVTTPFVTVASMPQVGPMHILQ